MSITKAELDALADECERETTYSRTRMDRVVKALRLASGGAQLQRPCGDAATCVCEIAGKTTCAAPPAPASEPVAWSELADYLNRLEDQLIAADADGVVEERIPPSVWADRIRAATPPQAQAGVRRDELIGAVQRAFYDAGQQLRFEKRILDPHASAKEYFENLLIEGSERAVDAILAALASPQHSGQMSGDVPSIEQIEQIIRIEFTHSEDSAMVRRASERVWTFLDARAKTLARQTTTSVLPRPEGQGVECDGGLRSPGATTEGK